MKNGNEIEVKAKIIGSIPGFKNPRKYCLNKYRQNMKKIREKTQMGPRTRLKAHVSDNLLCPFKDTHTQ